MPPAPEGLPPTIREPPPIYGLIRRLVEARERRGLSQRAAARMLTCSRSTLKDFEDGRRMPDLWWAGELANLYGCTVDWLIRGGPWPTPAAPQSSSPPPPAPRPPVPSPDGR